MRLRDKTDMLEDRADTVRFVLELLSNLLCMRSPESDVHLSPGSADGLAALLFACAETLEDIK